mmetsp:Transcript_38593/g.64790  ORF Transcript_38593/g.64790 Transcript_38593/m.64790 type:complete len:92 (+) Transcript_38593:1737-2012(+)
MGGRKKFYFIIMESVFYTARYIHLIYDLKGSSYRREATDKDIDRDPTQNFTCTVLKVFTAVYHPLATETISRRKYLAHVSLLSQICNSRTL